MLKKRVYKYFYLTSIFLCLLSSLSTVNAQNYSYMATNAVHKPNGNDPYYPSIDISADGKKLYLVGAVLMGKQGELRIVNLEDRTVERIPDIAGSDIVTSLDGNGAYVVDANQFTGGNQLKLIDVVNRKIALIIPASDYTYKIAMDSDGNRGYFASLGDGKTKSVSIFDPKTNLVIKTIKPANDKPTDKCAQHFVIGYYDVAISPDGKKLYLADMGNQSLAVLDLKTYELKSNAIHTLDHCPTSISVDRSGNRLYVGSYFDNTIDVIDTTTDKLIDTISVGSYPTNVVLALDGKKAYVLNSESNTVSVVDTSNNHIITTLGSYFTNPWAGVVSKDGRYVYIVNRVDTKKDTMRVTVIDALTDKIADLITIS